MEFFKIGKRDVTFIREMRVRLIKGLCLLFLPNVPGATFIQGGTSIPESRVASLSGAAMALCLLS